MKTVSIERVSDHDYNQAVFLSDALSVLQAYQNHKLTNLAKALQQVAATTRTVLQPTVEYQKTSKQTSLKRRLPEENSITTMAVSAKRRLSSQRYHPLYRQQKVVLVRLRTRHNMHRKLKLVPHQSAAVVKKTKPQSMLYKDVPFTKL